MPKSNPTNVDNWIQNRSQHQVKAIEKASKIFDEEDSLTVNTIESVYAQESSFGKKEFLGTPGSTKPAGHFQQKKDSALEQGLTVTKTNDERFDVDTASIGAAKQLKTIDKYFSKKTKLFGNTYTTAVANINERKKITLGAYNIGQGRVAKAQELAKKAGKDPTNWEAVASFLEEAGATKSQAEEAKKYVREVLKNEKEFSEKSKANKKLKDKKPAKESHASNDGNWVTLEDGRHVFIENKS